MNNPRSLARLLSTAILSLAVIGTALRAQGDDLEQHLRNQYVDKTFVLRNFYSGYKLTYDSTGRVTSSAILGDWTVDGFVRLEDFRISRDRLNIRAKRLFLARLGRAPFEPIEDFKGEDRKQGERARRLELEVDLRPGPLSAAQIESLLSRIFLSPQDRFAGLVPDYWKLCVGGAAQETENARFPFCRLAPDLLAVPGVTSKGREGSSDDASSRDSAPAPVSKVYRGKDVVQPKAFYAPSAEYTEEARRTHLQGSTTLSIVVDERGGVRDIRIFTPLGCGLDESAVEQVARWRFNPGTKDGQPVAVEMAVEVDFHQY